MKVRDFFTWMDAEIEKEERGLYNKGKEYTVSSEDKLKNFKSIAERLNMKPENVLLVYLLKHMDSIRNYVFTGTEACEESISGRIRDARNYLILLHAMILETKHGEDNEFKENGRPDVQGNKRSGDDRRQESQESKVGGRRKGWERRNEEKEKSDTVNE
jgi:hypothetical protein